MVFLIDDILEALLGALWWLLKGVGWLLLELLEILFEVTLWLLWTALQAGFEGLRALIQRVTRRAPPESARARLRERVERSCGKLRVSRARQRGRCLLCREELSWEEANAACSVCGVEVHTECRRELASDGACATLGCDGRLEDEARPAEPDRTSA